MGSPVGSYLRACRRCNRIHRTTCISSGALCEKCNQSGKWRNKKTTS